MPFMPTQFQASLTSATQQLENQLTTFEMPSHSHYQQEYEATWVTPTSEQGLELFSQKLRDLCREYQMEYGAYPWYWDTDFMHTIEDPPRNPNFVYPYQSDTFRIGNHTWRRRRVRTAVQKRPLYRIGETTPFDIIDYVEEEWVIQTNGMWTEFRREVNGVEAQVWRFEYAWCCKPDTHALPGRAGITGQFAPLSEFQEVQPEDYITWENNIIGNEAYRLMQEQAQVILLTVTREAPIYQEKARADFREGLYRVITPKVEHPKKITENYKSPLYCIAEITPERRAELLLKSWLTDSEYAALVSDGELAIPSQHEKDTIYIVKRNPSERVRVKKAGKEVQQLCVVPSTHEVPQSDNLLAKILFLKSDEKKFIEMAGKYGPETSSRTPNTTPYNHNDAFQQAWGREVAQFQAVAASTQWIQYNAATANTSPTTIYQVASNQVQQWVEQPNTNETVIQRQVDAQTTETTTYLNGMPISVRTTRR